MIAKQERYDLETAVYAMRHDGGTRAMYEWLKMRRDEVNAQWPGAEGAELLQLQGEAKLIARQIRLIEQGPTIKQKEGNKS